MKNLPCEHPFPLKLCYNLLHIVYFMWMILKLQEYSKYKEKTGNYICIMYRMAPSSAVIMSVKSVEAGFWI